MKNLLKFISKLALLFSFLILSPVSSFAQVTFANPPTSQACIGNGLGKFICQIQQLLNLIVPILIALGVVYFIWGIVNYIISDSEEAKKTGKERIIFGVIGFAVILGLWGLVNVVVKTFNLSASAPSLAPLTGGSTTCSIGTNVQGLLGYATCIINNSIIPLIFAVAVVMFVWGTVQFFIINADEAEKRAQGKQFMIWGIVALAVMLSVWGLVTILGNTFGINATILPQVRPPGSSSSNPSYPTGSGCMEGGVPVPC